MARFLAIGLLLGVASCATSGAAERLKRGTELAGAYRDARSSHDRDEAARDLIALAGEYRTAILLHREQPQWLESEGRQLTLEAFQVVLQLDDDSLGRRIKLEFLGVSTEARRCQTPLHVIDFVAEHRAITLLSELAEAEDAKRRAALLLVQMNELMGDPAELRRVLARTEQRPSPSPLSEWHFGADSILSIVFELVGAFDLAIPQALPDRCESLARDRVDEWFHIARLYERAGMPARAREYYERVVAKADLPDDQRRRAREALDRLKQ